MSRPRVYLLNLRQFSNTCETRELNGSLAKNGVGKFRDIDDVALQALRDLGISHLWLLGVPRHATGTDYSSIGLPADDPDLLKGVAGSPYAVRDYFDVCPDYAVEPAARLQEFTDLVRRIHDAGLSVIIDFIPNHVARSYHSVIRPDLDFGRGDDPTRFMAADNNFYYLDGPGPLRLPTVQDGRPVSATCRALGGCDGAFEGERVHGRVTGNNVISWSPGLGDWYETVKLNYGFDFRAGPGGERLFPTTAHPDRPIPDTWHKMDAILAHWQSLGVDGFRCDMAHWVPMEFWRWAIGLAHRRNPAAIFIAEAYNDDPNKVMEGNVMAGLIEAGFDAVYDHASYGLLKGIFEGPKWANDLDQVLGSIAPLHASVRYAENHDEVRLAHPAHWGGVGSRVGWAVSALVMGIGRGPVLLYNGQEVGEVAAEVEGFGGGEGRSSIFDYGSMPALARWVNGHRYDGGRSTEEERVLRDRYRRLLRALAHETLGDGDFIPLNGANVQNSEFGRLPGEVASGHWTYAYLRASAHVSRPVMVVANLHPSEGGRPLSVWLTELAWEAVGRAVAGNRVRFRDLLGGIPDFELGWDEIRQKGICVPGLPPATTCFLEMTPPAPDRA